MATRRVDELPGTRTSLRIDCVVRTDRVSPHHRIRAIGGVDADGRRWRMTEEAAIASIEHERASFYVVLPPGRLVDVIVGHGLGKSYLKAEPDGESPDVLLGLRDCG